MYLFHPQRTEASDGYFRWRLSEEDDSRLIDIELKWVSLLVVFCVWLVRRCYPQVIQIEKFRRVVSVRKTVRPRLTFWNHAMNEDGATYLAA